MLSRTGWIKDRGPLGTLLVESGILKVGDYFVSGNATLGKVRAMVDDHGRNVTSAPPSSVVEVAGFSSLPFREMISSSGQ